METHIHALRCAHPFPPGMIETVIFDVDGTLVDSVDLHAHAWQDAFREYGKEIPFEDVRFQIGKGGDQLMPGKFGHGQDMSMAPADQFNEYESVSSLNNVQYNQFASSELRSAIAQKLTAMGSPLTVTDVLNRATTQSCAGCHQIANGMGLGGGMRWPTSLEFTQIDENRALSQALLTTFLPRRREILESFINGRCMANPGSRVAEDIAAKSAANLTIGGSSVGSPN